MTKEEKLIKEILSFGLTRIITNETRTTQVHKFTHPDGRVYTTHSSGYVRRNHEYSAGHWGFLTINPVKRTHIGDSKDGSKIYEYKTLLLDTEEKRLERLLAYIRRRHGRKGYSGI